VNLCSNGDSPSMVALFVQVPGSCNYLHLSLEQSDNFSNSSSTQTAFAK